MKPNLTPEQLTAIEAEKAKQKAKLDVVRLAVNSANTDENVRIILKYLMEVSGFRDNPVVINSNREITNATNYNIGMEAVFHNFRKLMSAETENLIEKREE